MICLSLIFSLINQTFITVSRFFGKRKKTSIFNEVYLKS